MLTYLFVKLLVCLVCIDSQWKVKIRHDNMIIESMVINPVDGNSISTIGVGFTVADAAAVLFISPCFGPFYC